MTRDIEYYLDLPYKIEVNPIPREIGGGYNASIPELGKHALNADGDTIEEAIANLNAYKKEYINRLIENGVAIPEPAREDDFSGKFVLRIEPWLHKLLKEKSQEESESLNTYIRKLLIDSFRIESYQRQKDERIFAELRKLNVRMESLEDAFSHSHVSYAVEFLGFQAEPVLIPENAVFATPATASDYGMWINETIPSIKAGEDSD